MEITIRKVQEEDYIDVLGMWNRELGYTKVNQDSVANYYNRVGNDPGYKSFVAVCDGGAVGFITAVTYFSIGCEGKVMRITALAVKKEYQNKGIGGRLLCQMEEAAKADGMENIHLSSGLKRLEAHAFYDSRGYDMRSYSFSKML